MHVAKANGKEMSTYILRFLKAARTWQAENTWPDQLKVLLREFHSHCLNCVIAIISCTNTNEKVYNNYIFMENKGSNELLWNRIMDTESKIRLDMVFEKALTTRKDYVSIKHSYNDIQYLLTSASQQFHYLSDSSLSQDVSRWGGDFDYLRFIHLFSVFNLFKNKVGGWSMLKSYYFVIF